MAGTDTDEVLSLITLVNLAVVALALGKRNSAVTRTRAARNRLRHLDAPHYAELHEILAAVEWRIAEAVSREQAGRFSRSGWHPPVPSLGTFAARAAAGLSHEIFKVLAPGQTISI